MVKCCWRSGLFFPGSIMPVSGTGTGNAMQQPESLRSGMRRQTGDFAWHQPWLCRTSSEPRANLPDNPKASPVKIRIQGKSLKSIHSCAICFHKTFQYLQNCSSCVHCIFPALSLAPLGCTQQVQRQSHSVPGQIRAGHCHVK